MAWTAPRTWTTGELVTAAIMNTHIRDNQLYLKTEVDKIDDCVFSSPGYALDTEYQHTGGGILFVTCSFVCRVITSDDSTLDGKSYCTAFIGSGSPPFTTVGKAGIEVDDVQIVGAHDDMWSRNTLFFLVPNNWYYQVTASQQGDGALPFLDNWHQWLVH